MIVVEATIIVKANASDKDLELEMSILPRNDYCSLGSNSQNSRLCRKSRNIQYLTEFTLETEKHQLPVSLDLVSSDKAQHDHIQLPSFREARM